MESVIREGTLRLLLLHNTTCDVILSCQGNKLMAHKLMLSMASPIFKTLLKESADCSVIIFPDVKSQIMSLILEYIYSGKVTITSNLILQDFVNLAEMLRIKIESKFKDLPALIPINKIKAKMRRNMLNCILPSPWRQKETALGDPKDDKDIDGVNNEDKVTKPNDSNNNNLVEDTSTVLNLKMTLNSLKNLKNLNRQDKVKPYKCEECNKSFSQIRNYKYHRSLHEGTKEFAAKCEECGKTFNDKGYLSSHMKIHRNHKEYACNFCPKRFNQRVAYNMHLRIHTGVKPHECNVCGKSFSRKMLLKQHQRVHTGERPYSCPECGKTFADRSNMSLHARLHTGVKPYGCTLCPKSFTKKHHLKTHMNFHTGLKPYKCEKCGLAFSQSSNMRTHYKKCLLKNSQDSSNVDIKSENSNSN